MSATNNIIGCIYKALKQSFAENEIETADLDTRLILEYCAGVKWSTVISSPDKKITKKEAQNIYKAQKQRLAGKPISKIFGCKEFWGLDFEVNEHVLDPRPDTETLISTALEIFKDKPPKKILDLGTGSGCILLSLLHEWKQTTGVGTDISPKALKLAKKNAYAHGLEGRTKWIESSWLDNINESDFNLIVSNPPYIRTGIIPNLNIEVQKYDPILALDGGEDGLRDYKKILFQINHKINHPVRILLEIGYDQSDDLTRLVGESRFTLHAIHHDLQGNPRVVDISSGDK